MRIGILALLSVLVTTVISAEEERGGVEWHPAAKALELSKKERLAILVVVPGRESDRTWTELQKQLLRFGTVKKWLKRVVPMEADGDSRELTDLVGEVGGTSEVLVLNFRGAVLHRWRGEVPKRRDFIREMKLAVSENHALANRFAQGERALRTIRLAIKLGKYRNAVQALLGTAGLSLPPDAKITLDLENERAEIEKEYVKRDKHIKKLEEQRRYTSVLARLEDLLREFPFPEREKGIRKRITYAQSMISR